MLIRHILSGIGIALTIVGASPCVAAPGDISLAIYGAARYPLIDNGTGIVHAFMCFDYQLNSGIKEECYGFYPAPETVNSISLSGGGQLIKSSDDTWTEVGTSHVFTARQSPASTLILYDSNRNLTWTLNIPVGASTWNNGGADNPYVRVIGAGYDPGGNMIAGGPGVLSDEWNANATRFTNVTVTFKRNISSQQRSAILTVLKNTKGMQYHLTSSSCIDLVDAVAAAAGLKRPARYSLQLPAAYVQQLKGLNP